MSTRPRGPSPADLVGLGALGIGAVLRLWHLGGIQVFSDEVHSLHVAAQESFGWIATHATRTDACIPYTLYNKLLLETVGLDEWAMRLPAALAGILTTLTAWHYARRLAGAWLAAGVAVALGLSPYLVYLSREARPYAIVMWLVTWAGGLLLDTEPTARSDDATTRRRLCGAGALLAIAAYFHPIVIPAAVALWAAPLLLGPRGNGRDPVRRRPRVLASWAVATATSLALALLLMGPYLASFWHHVGQRAAKGDAGLETARHAFVLLHGLRVALPVWLWLGLAGVGLVSAARRWPRRCAIVAASLALQLATIQIVQPVLSELPWVWIRYWAHLLPLLAIWVGCGLASLAPAVGVRAPRTAALALAACMLAYLAAQLSADRYVWREHQHYPAHPIASMMPATPDRPEPPLPLLDFYRELSQRLPDDAIVVESPRVFVFPFYDRYAAIHGRRMRTAAAGSGFRQSLLEAHPGLEFRTVWPPPSAGEASPTYWIHHKQVKRELRQWIDFALRDPFARPQLDTASFLFGSGLVLFGSDAELAAFAPAGGELITEGPYVKLFRMVPEGSAGE